jgi:hypothetical protein
VFLAHKEFLVLKVHKDHKAQQEHKEDRALKALTA